MGAESPKEECGLFGVWAPGDEVARLTYFGLFAQQHRGQESAGIAVSDGTNILVYKDLGLVSQVFNEATLTTLHGDLAVGHTRYSTTGSTTWDNAQPVFKTDGVHSIALGHNGNLVNTSELAERVRGAGLATTDSRLRERSVHEARREMGRILAKEHPADADLVIAVPTTGHSAAQGFSEVSGIPYGDGLYKNTYVGRTFLQPSQSLRDRGVKLKLNPLPDSIRGKRLVVVDDSIVRGTTTKQIVQALREAGAAEVHIRITCPPIQWPCFYGIDMPTRQELIAADLTVDQIRSYVSADSLGYLSLDGMVAPAGDGKETFCRACFDGEYPIEIPEGAGKYVLEDQLKLPTG